MSTLSFALLLASLVVSDTSSTMERFAIVVGNDEADGRRPALRYAERDAHEMAAVLQEIGGVKAVELVLGREPAALDRAFDRVNAAIRERGGHATLLLYYSGHADAEGLLMGAKRYDFAPLRERLKDSAAQLFIAVIDACQSGAITRAKGGVAVPVVDVVEADRHHRGGVFIASTRSGENAQESDELEGSFFTRSLVNGLRGAADESGDGRVSLNEAYQFAYHHTVSRTQKTLLGAQHPTYDVSVAGQGELVLSWPSSARTALVIPEAMGGSFIVRSERALTIEIEKSEGKAMHVVLEPGVYEVSRSYGGHIGEISLELERGNTVTLDERSMIARRLHAMNTSKGSTHDLGVELELFYRSRTAFLAEGSLRHGLELGVGFPSGPMILGLRGSGSTSGYTRADGYDVSTREIGLAVFADAAWPLSQIVCLRGGFELGLGFAHQSGRQTVAGLTARNASAVVPFAFRAGASFRAVDGLAFGLFGDVGGLGYRTEDDLTLRPVLGVGAGVMFSP